MRHKTVEPLVTSASRNEQRGPIKVGDYVQWTSNGIDQFKPVRKITQTQGNHVWVHGSQTGIPLSEVTSAEPPAPIPVAKLATPAKSGPSDNGQHPVNTAAALFRRLDRRWRSSGSSLFRDSLLEALDAIIGEGWNAILANAINAQATVFGKHVDLEFPQPFVIFAEHFGNVVDGENVGDCRQG